MVRESWQLEDDRILSAKIAALDDDPWSLEHIMASNSGRIGPMLFELMQRIRALESELRQLKGG